jgi:hypothetical protein
VKRLGALLGFLVAFAVATSLASSTPVYSYDGAGTTLSAGRGGGLQDPPGQVFPHPTPVGEQQPSQGYDDRSQLAGASARLGGYRLAPNTARLADDAVRAGDAGSFGGLQARSIVGDALDLHHMPQRAAGFTSSPQGGALAMPQAEHMLTRTYGFRGAQALKADAGLSFRQVLARDIWDVRSIAGSSYNQGLRDRIGYYRTNFPELMARGGGL